jgi:hypothetical protein
LLRCIVSVHVDQRREQQGDVCFMKCFIILP